MKRNIKKIISLVLVLAMSLAMSVPSFAAEKEDNDYNKNEILVQAPDYYSEEYQSKVQETAQNVKDFINKKLTRSGERESLSVPLYKQQNGYYCGPACAQMTLKYVTGNLYSQSSLASNMGTTKNSGTYVYKMAQELNNKAGSNTYRYVQTSDIGFASGLYYSINRDKPVICHTNTKGLPNYGSKNCSHYIVSIGYAYDTAGYDSVRYNDPNNDNANYGTYECSYSQMTDAINNRAGYYIMAS